MLESIGEERVGEKNKEGGKGVKCHSGEVTEKSSKNYTSKCYYWSWLGSSVGERCPRYAKVVGHIQVSTNKCINKWNDKSKFLSPPSL